MEPQRDDISDQQSGAQTAERCGGAVALPVMPAPRPRSVRPSRMGRRRATVLIAVHVLILGHVIHWLVAGRTLSPVEPSEAMYTLNDGYLNAGFIFFVLAIAATAIFGRFFCGWGCHLVAYQDLCASLLKRIGIKPKPFRSRLLVLGPLGLALYMFVWPSAYRLAVGAPAPRLTNHLVTTEFWATFPGVGIAMLTFALCGFAIVYVLGAKGFCTYACPYGGFFALADRIAPGRIRVTDACAHCGHCTAVCSSNVRVHEEVARHGMVVDPGCMKCMDCVSVCPNDALYFGFAAPGKKRESSGSSRGPHYDYTLGEELFMIVVGLAALLSYRGLYNQIPLLLAMGMAAMTAYLVMKLVRLVRDPHVRWQQLQLKRGGRLTRSGVVFAVAMVAWLAFTSHSAAVQYASWRGRLLIDALALGDDVWESRRVWWDEADADHRAQLERGLAYLERVDRWGLLPTPLALNRLVWGYLARGRVDEAEAALRRLAQTLPKQAEPHRGLAWIMRRRGDIEAAIEEYASALRREPKHQRSRRELVALLIEQRRFDEAEAVCREGVALMPEDVEWPLALGRLLVRQGRAVEAIEVLERAAASSPDSAPVHSALGMALLQAQQVDQGIAHLRRAAALDPDSGEAHYNLGYALLSLRRVEEAIPHLERAIARDDTVAPWHYNLAVALFMRGDPDAALPHIRRAVDLDPTDPQAWGFLGEVLEALGDVDGAASARREAEAASRTSAPSP